jgi:hypothetical protein
VLPYTDGLTEARHDGRLLGLDAVTAELKGLHRPSPKEAVAVLRPRRVYAAGSPGRGGRTRPCRVATGIAGLVAARLARPGRGSAARILLPLLGGHLAHDQLSGGDGVLHVLLPRGLLAARGRAATVVNGSSGVVLSRRRGT